MSSGHIPNSFSLPFDRLRELQVDVEGRSYTTLKDRAGLRQTILDALGNEDLLSKHKVVNTCGSGMSAAM